MWRRRATRCATTWPCTSAAWGRATRTSTTRSCAAARVQDLYLEGKRDEAAAALPGELIDTVTLVGPADRVRERLEVFRSAGVGTLLVSPMAWTREERLAQLRQLAELAA